jgi:adenosylcobinamide-phosphate synthase
MHHFSDRVLVAAIALIVSIILGNNQILRGFFMLHLPERVFSGFALAMERRLNRPQRGARTLRSRGWFFMMLCVLGASVIGQIFTYFSMHFRAAQLAEIVCLAMMMDVYVSYRMIVQVRSAVQKNTLSLARQLMEKHSIKDVERLDDAGLLRNAIEEMAVGLCVHVVVPCVAYVAGGMPLALSCIVVLKIYQSYQRLGVEKESFFAAVRVCTTLIYALFGRVYVLMIVCASLFSAGANAAKACQGLSRWGHGFAHKEDGMIAVWAGSLGISLAGPYSSRGVFKDRRWIGDGSAKVTIEDVARALWLYKIVIIMLMIAIFALNIRF